MGSTVKGWLAGDKNFDFFKKAGVTWRLIMLGIVGILLLVISASLDTPQPQADKKIASGETVKKVSQVHLSYEEELENKLANLLSQIKGAGSVSVNVTLENGPYSEHAKNITKENRTTQEKDSSGGIRTTTETKETEQILFSKDSGVDRPVMVREYKPVIKGVVVVAEGAGDSVVKANITKAVEAGIGLASYKIVVLAQRK